MILVNRCPFLQLERREPKQIAYSRVFTARTGHSCKQIRWKVANRSSKLGALVNVRRSAARGRGMSSSAASRISSRGTP